MQKYRAAPMPGHFPSEWPVECGGKGLAIGMFLTPGTNRDVYHCSTLAVWPSGRMPEAVYSSFCPQ